MLKALVGPENSPPDRVAANRMLADLKAQMALTLFDRLKNLDFRSASGSLTPLAEEI